MPSSPHAPLPAVSASHPTARHGGRTEAMVLTLVSRPRAPFGAWLPTVFAEPSGELAGPADRAQPALGFFPHGGGGDDEQAVAGLQRRGVRRDESLATADDEGHVGLGGQPQFEDLHA